MSNTEISAAAGQYAQMSKNPMAPMYEGRIAMQGFEAGANWANTLKEAEIERLKKENSELKAELIFRISGLSV
jgi:hypothetical protein